MSVVLNLFVALMLPGMIVRTRALLAGRKGAPFYQHISRLGALLCKAPVYSPATGFVFRLAPVVYLATDSDLGVVESVRQNTRAIASLFGLEDTAGELMTGFDSRVAWCACFVSWCYGQAGLSEPRFAGCQSQGVPWFTSHGQWGAKGYENIAPGDAIFFDWDLDGSADHVGIVIGTDGSRVYTVEGNSGDACKIKSYSLTYECIKGYGLMNW